MLVTYSPLSLLYTLLVLGVLFQNLFGWTLSNIPMLALLGLIAWLGWLFLDRIAGFG